jgi:hypothetical protein
MQGAVAECAVWLHAGGEYLQQMLGAMAKSPLVAGPSICGAIWELAADPAAAQVFVAADAVPAVLAVLRAALQAAPKGMDPAHHWLQSALQGLEGVPGPYVGLLARLQVLLPSCTMVMGSQATLQVCTASCCLVRAHCRVLGAAGYMHITFEVAVLYLQPRTPLFASSYVACCSVTCPLLHRTMRITSKQEAHSQRPIGAADAMRSLATTCVTFDRWL